MKSVLDTLQSFTVEDLPDLDLVVLGALELFAHTAIPTLPLDRFKRPLVIGSVNAAYTGRILFANTQAYFADESDYQTKLHQYNDIDGVVIISASGGKHAVGAAAAARQAGLPTLLCTNNSEPAAARYIEKDNILVFPKNREPYTYNTSTYLGMILGLTGEDTAMIESHITKQIRPRLLRDFSMYNSFTFILPPQFAEAVPMVRTKFDELFGPYVQGRVFTSEEIKHAKTVTTSGDELFIAVGVDNMYYGVAKNRWQVSLPEKANYAAVIAVSYYIVGMIQKAQPPYFKNNIIEYTALASKIFDQQISPIVE